MRACCPVVVIALAASGCGSVDYATTSSSVCADPDATTSLDDADLDASPDAAPTSVGYADALVEPADVASDASDDDTLLTDDPDNGFTCKGMLVLGAPSTTCDAVVRLDYDSRRVLGWRLVCGDGPPLDDARSRTLAQASLGVDIALDQRMTGFDPGFYHAPTATSPGAFAIVHPDIGRVVVSGTMMTGGGALTETAWNPPWDPTRCFPEFDLLSGSAVVPVGEPSFGDSLAKKVAHSAWYGPIGALWEEAGGCTKNAYRADVMRWAPEPGGPYREWIVVIEVGTDCTWLDD